MAAPDAFRLNAYRVLRIPVSASSAEINKAAARMRRAEPEVRKTSGIDLPELGDVARAEDDIRAALYRLASPVQRLTDSLLWFSKLPIPGSSEHTSSGMDPVGHDNALRALIKISTTQAGLDDAGLAAWVKALRGWHAVTSDDDYWFLSLMHEDQGGFEPPATTPDVDGVRNNAVRIAAEPLIRAARAALVAHDRATVLRVIAALSELTATGPWAKAAIEELASKATV